MSEYYDDSIYEAVGTGEAAQEETHQDIPADMPPVDQPKKPHKKNGGKKGVALALVCALLGGGMGVGGGFLGASLARGNLPQTVVSGDGVSTVMQGVRETSVLQIQQIDSSKELTAAEVYAANVNSTVGIVTSAVTTNYWGFPTTSAAAGSGFILTEDGYILTNYHVVENSNSITVAMYNGDTYDAALIGYDESNDVAVLKIDAQGLSPVVLGDSDNLNVGDSVVAIGNPLGELTFSLTAGAVSALNRDVTMSSGSTQELIQTDCAINSGNSGGALFNLYGEVIGITNAKYSSSSSSSASIDNIGFAIPINHVKNIITSIIEKGYIVKPYIGVSVTDVSEETQSYGLPGGGDPDGDRADRGQKTSGVEPEEGQLLPSDRIVRKSFCRNVARDRYGVLARDAAGDFVAFAIGDDAVRRHRRQNPGRFHGVVRRDEGPDFGVGRSDGQLHRSAPAFRIAESGHAGRGDEANVFPDHRGDVQGAGRGVVKPFGADPGAVPGAEYFQKQFRFRRVGERVGERAEYGGKHLRQRGECHVKTGLEVDDCVRSEIPCGRRCRGCGRSRVLRFFSKDTEAASERPMAAVRGVRVPKNR